jgi:ABC-type molybdenum transport system ATPase subunit/photorepair protein PhrA
LRLALTFVHSPRVLLLDEPRNSLDETGLEMLAGAVSDVLACGGSVLWCAPAGEEQPVRFDRSYVIADGTLHPTDGRG